MSNEEIQKMLEFVIKQQESFAENMEKAEARMSRMEGALVGVFAIVTETAKTQKELVEAQKQTDERLNALINIVELSLAMVVMVNHQKVRVSL